MFKRLAVYYKEMFPLLPRFFVAAIMFFEIYFVLLLNDGVTTFHFQGLRDRPTPLSSSGIAIWTGEKEGPGCCPQLYRSGVCTSQCSLYE